MRSSTIGRLGLLGLFAAVLSASGAGAQESLKYGSAVKLEPVFYLPVMAAQEKGFFKQRGLDVEYVPLQSGSDMQRALAAGAIKIGASGAASDVLSVARGVPVITVGNLQSYDDFGVWVATNSRIHTPQDLKGAKIGVSRLGGLEHSYGLLVTRQLGLGDEVKFVSTGGISESLALLTTGGIDGIVLAPEGFINLVLEKRVRPVLHVKDYLPKSWAAFTIVARKDFVEKETDTAKKMMQSLIEADRYIGSGEGKAWALAKMQEVNGYTAEGAKLVYDTLALSTDGEIAPGAIQNVADFMVTNGLLKANEVPTPDRLYTDRLLH